MQATRLLAPGVVLGLLGGLFLGWLLFSASPTTTTPQLPEPDSTPGPDEPSVELRGSVDADRIAHDANASRAEIEDTNAPFPVTDRTFGTIVYGAARAADDGELIEDCNITFEPSGGGKRLSVESGTHGFALTGLQPGTWKVSSKPKNFQRLQTEVEILAQPSQRLDLAFERATLVHVKIQTPDGVPLREAIAKDPKLGSRVAVVAIASRDPLPGNLPMTELRSHWRYGIGRYEPSSDAFRRRRQAEDGPPADVSGTLEIAGQLPLYVSAVFRHVVLATEPVHAGQSEVVLTVSLDDLRASTSTIRARIVDAATGLGIPQAKVSISDSQSGGGGIAADENGSIVFEGERVGILEVDIYAKGYQQFHTLVRLDPGDHDLGTFRLHRGHDVELRIVDPQGEPIASATIHCQNLEQRDFPQPSLWRRRYAADAGKATISGLGTGRHLVQAYVRDKSWGTTVLDPATAGPEPVTIVLEPTVKVSFGASADPYTGPHCLTIYDTKRVPVWARWIRGFTTSAQLPAGRYTWEVHDGTELIKSGELELRAGVTPARIQLR